MAFIVVGGAAAIAHGGSSEVEARGVDEAGLDPIHPGEAAHEMVVVSVGGAVEGEGCGREKRVFGGLCVQSANDGDDLVCHCAFSCAWLEMTLSFAQPRSGRRT